MSEERHLLERILCILERAFAVTDFQLFQREGDFVTMAITGVQAGSTGTFQIGFVPPNGVPLPTPPTVTVDDTNVMRPCPTSAPLPKPEFSIERISHVRPSHMESPGNRPAVDE